VTFSVWVADNASSDDSALIVDRSLEMKSNIIQINDVHFSDMINKVENTNILLKFQSSHTISISASIKDILTSSCKRPIENSILFVDNKANSDSIDQHIEPYGKADGSSSSKLKLPKSTPLTLKPTSQKNRLKKSKYTFDFKFYDHVFDFLLKNNFIRIIDSFVKSSAMVRQVITECIIVKFAAIVGLECNKGKLELSGNVGMKVQNTLKNFRLGTQWKGPNVMCIIID
jgi:hypothetical protein